MMSRRKALAAVVVVALALVLPAPARAAHPFITEDPGTQGTGHLELELGAAARQGAPDLDGRETGFFPQLSIGATPTLDLIVQAIWLSQRPAQGPVLLGSGDMLADVKWRFYEDDDLAFAVRAGLDLPTGDSATGLGAGGTGVHAIAIVGVKFGAYAVYANGDYAHTRQPGARANLGGFSVALTRPADTPWRTFIEAATFSNPDPKIAQWPAVARTGLIYSVNDTLDLDVGIQSRLNRAATRVVWLAGATLRW